MPDSNAPVICGACGAHCAGKEYYAKSVLSEQIGTFRTCDHCASLRIVDVVDYEKLYDSRASTNYSQSDVRALVRLKEWYLRAAARSLLVGASRNARILDYGCGGGELSNAISAMGFSAVYATDVQDTPPSTLSKTVHYFSAGTDSRNRTR